MKRARVGLGAEAVVGHRVEVAVAGVQQRGEPADRLRRAGRGHRIGVDDTGERRRERRVGGQDRPRLELRAASRPVERRAAVGASRSVRAAEAVMSRLMPGT